MMKKFQIAKGIYAIDVQPSHTTIAVSRELYEQVKSHPSIISSAEKPGFTAFGGITIYIGEQDGSITQVEQ